MPHSGGKLLITSPFPFWSEWAECVAVDVLPLEKAIEFLNAKAKRSDVDGARELANVLDRLPLALDHAAALCLRTHLSFNDYAVQAAKLIAVRPPGSIYPSSVVATFDLAISEAARNLPPAEFLMAVLAQCAPERIPMALFEGAVNDDSEHVRAVAVLSELSLIKHDSVPDGMPAISVHRLVQSVAYGRSQANGTAMAALDYLLTRLLELYPQDDAVFGTQENWSLCDQLTPHIFGWAQRRRPNTPSSSSWTELIEFVRETYSPPSEAQTGIRSFWTKLAGKLRREQPVHQNHPSLAAWPQLVERAADYFYARASYPEAVTLWRAILSFWEAVVGPNDAQTAKCLNNLAIVLRAAGDFGAAKTLLLRALAIHENLLGPEHPDTTANLDSLGSLASRMGDLRGARSSHDGAFAIRRKTPGPADAAIAQSLEYLASCSREEGDLATARILMERSLAITESIFGAEDHATIMTLNGVAIIYQQQGELEEARIRFEKVCKAVEARPGTEHLELALSLNNLARVLQDQNNFAAALPLFERALEIRERIVGSNHHLTAESFHNLASLQMSIGDFSAAKSLFEAALEIEQYVFGHDHPTVATTYSNLADVHFALAEFDVSKKLHEHALAIRRKRLPPDHPDLATSLRNVGVMLATQERFVEAESLLTQSLRICERSLG